MQMQPYTRCKCVPLFYSADSVLLGCNLDGHGMWQMNKHAPCLLCNACLLSSSEGATAGGALWLRLLLEEQRK